MKSEIKSVFFLIKILLVVVGSILFLNRDDSVNYPASEVVFSLFMLGGLILFVRKKYGRLSLIYPGLWFAATWILAIVSYILLQLWGYVPVQVDELLKTLLLYVNLTALFFIVAMIFHKKPVVNYSTSLSNGFMGSQFVLTIVLIIVFIGALANWIGIGAPLGYSDTIRQQWLESIPKITAITWYPFHLIYPASFFIGWKLFDFFSRKDIVRIKYYISCLLLLFSIFLWSMGTGGRQVVGFVMLYFLVGVLYRFSIDKGQSVDFAKIRKKAAYVFGGLIVFFALFSTVTNQIRAVDQGSQKDNPFSGTVVLENFGFFIYYMGGTLMTTQAYGVPVKRDLTETGPVSFNGLLDLGVGPLTLYDLLGLRRNTTMDTNPERGLAQSGQEMASGTRNIYYDLESDFGFYGSTLAILCLVLVSHFIFAFSLTSLNRKTLFKLTPLIFILVYWQYSQQLSLMMHAQFKWTLTSFLIWAMFHNILRNRRI